jgi:hypothetical protein
MTDMTHRLVFLPESERDSAWRPNIGVFAIGPGYKIKQQFLVNSFIGEFRQLFLYFFASLVKAMSL